MATATAGGGLRDLYRQTVLDHSRHPRNFRRIEGASRESTGHNPLCGDKVSVYLRLSGEHIADVAFEATGCAICLASASLMTDLAAGQDVAAALREVDAFKMRFAPGATVAEDPADPLGALATVRDYPSRIRCATLPWETLRAALTGSGATVSTE
jgi:nitrogen fixation protein NifU and related proteins